MAWAASVDFYYEYSSQLDKEMWEKIFAGSETYMETGSTMDAEESSEAGELAGAEDEDKMDMS